MQSWRQTQTQSHQHLTPAAADTYPQQHRARRCRESKYALKAWHVEQGILTCNRAGCRHQNKDRVLEGVGIELLGTPHEALCSKGPATCIRATSRP